MPLCDGWAFSSGDLDRALLRAEQLQERHAEAGLLLGLPQLLLRSLHLTESALGCASHNLMETLHVFFMKSESRLPKNGVRSGFKSCPHPTNPPDSAQGGPRPAAETRSAQGAPPAAPAPSLGPRRWATEAGGRPER